MPIGSPRNFHDKFLFRVDFGGNYAGFRKCSELSVETAKIEHYEGGSMAPDKSAGRLTFSDVTLERGATSDLDLYNWFSQVAKAASNSGRGAGLVTPKYKRDVDIIQYDRAGNEAQRWRLHGAFPTKFVAGDWDNDSDDKRIESVTLTYDYFEPV